jgi:hypothetical protein
MNLNSPEILNWTEIRSFSSVQFRSKKFVPASSALSSVQFRSKKRGRIFWTRINAQKRSKNAPKRPKTPQNAPKRPKNAPKTPQNAPKTPVFWTWKRPFFSVQFSSGQFFQVRSVQVISGQFRSSTCRSGQFSSGESHLSGGPWTILLIFFEFLFALGCVLEIKSEISKFWSRKRAKKNQGKQRNQNFTKESEKIVIRKLGYRKDSDSKTGVQKR